MKVKKSLIFTIAFFSLFIIFTLLVCLVDVQSIGPKSSEVGFATINNAVFDALGENDLFYMITEILGFIPLAIAVCFAILGLYQAIQRKGVLKVDIEILLLGAFYITVLVAYVIFEIIKINYRPILIDGVLEASYPSSHTMLAVCFMVTAILELHRLLKDKNTLLILTDSICITIAAVIVVGRLLSGVHWFTDIVASLLLSSALISLYIFAVNFAKDKIAKKSKSK